MSIVSVDNIQPIGSGTTVTVNKSVTLESGNTNITGVCTATSFVGGLPITNGADNRVITSSSASAIQGESGFTFNGSLASIINSSGPTLELTTNTNAADASLRLHEGTTGSTTNGGGMFYSGADNKLHITCGTNLTTKRITITRDVGLIGINTDAPSSAWLDIAADTGTYDHLRLRRLSSDSNVATNWSLKPYGGNLYFRTGGSTDKIYFDDSGDLNIMDGNLMMGTSGHGIDFSATSDASGNTSELLDDYEEGSWTPTISAHLGGGSFTTNAAGRYVKVGRLVSLWGQLSWSAKGGSGVVNLNATGLPFATHNTAANNSSVCIGSRSGWNQLRLVGQMYQTGYINVQYINGSGNSINVNVSSLDNSGSISYRFQYESAT